MGCRICRQKGFELLRRRALDWYISPYFLINKGFRLAAELTKTVPGRYNLSFNVFQAMCVGAFFAAALHTRLLLCNVPPFIIDHIKGDRQWTSLKNAMRRA